MEKYDIVIVGAATSGAFFAQRMASKGYSVKVIEKQSFEDFGRKMDIFHVAKADFAKFGLPEAVPGDGAWAFEFNKNVSCSPYNHYPKRSQGTVVGMHMHEYIVKMNQWAKDAGAEIDYGAAFEDLLFENGRISGVAYRAGDDLKQLGAKLVVDCSGIPSVVRRKLPAGYGVENFALTPADMFYVTLWYVKLDHEADYLDGNTGWPFYKAWMAPQSDPTGAILGVGAVGSYEHGEAVFADLKATFPLPEHTHIRTERGATPYTRPPYSLVADHFIAAGDAACLTKPDCGEGVTSSMVQLEIAAEVADQALKQGEASLRRLWNINIRYNQAQGAAFAATRALFTKAVTATKDEFEYFFRHDMVFQDQPPAGEPAKRPAPLAWSLLKGVVTGKLSMATLKNLVSGVMLGEKLRKHYLNFPDDLANMPQWTETADALWAKVGKMR